MDLQLSPEQQQLRDATRKLLAERLDTLVSRLPEAPAPAPAQALRDAQAVGWLGLGLPESVGGAGGFEDLALVHEELGRGLAPSLVTTLGLAARLALHGGGPTALLEGLCAGMVLVAPAVGDLFSGGTAVRLSSGADGLRLDGVQRHVVDTRAVSQLLVAARDGNGTARLVLVPTDAPGLRLVDDEPAADIPMSTAAFDGVVVLQEHFLPGDADVALRAVRAEATTLAAARALGGGRAVLARSVEHVTTRHQFGRAIGTFQAVQHQLADVATALDAAGLAVARAAWAVEAGAEPQVLETAAAVAGLAAMEAFAAATLVAHQLHGGMGFVLDSPLHLWSARATADPTLPLGRRHLLDTLSTSLGITADGVRVPAPHRLS